MKGVDETSLWLAKVIFDLGGLTFGDYSIGRSTVHSPVYVNPRVLIGQPETLRRVARVIQQEMLIGQARLKPRCSPFDVVAGVPLGGLLLATAFALSGDVPLIYAVKASTAVASGSRAIEGQYQAGQTVLLIDDVITTGGSILETAAMLEDVGLIVRDVIVLVDRERGAGARLGEQGYNLIPLLKLKTMLNFYYANHMISQEWYEKSIAYLEGNQAAGLT